jgi:predicted methyltransferase
VVTGTDRMLSAVIVSHIQADELLRARAAGLARCSISPDLGRSRCEVLLNATGVTFPTGEQLRWEDVERARAAVNRCFRLENGGLHPIQTFSALTGRPCSLYATRGAPTLLIAGFVMHRVKEIDPLEDARRKVRTLLPIRGRVLDTATGLGYTAIEAARFADEVVTIELDPAVLEIARLNPWSQELFRHARIRLLPGDATAIVPTLPAGHFTRILHDPPAFDLAGDLYAGAFYRELYRVLRPGGRLFHYLGDLQSKVGSRLLPGVTKRLQEAGFVRVVPRPEAFGLLAYK